MINSLTIDLEPWWVNQFLAEYLPKDKEDQIEQAVRPILDLLNTHETKVTFFVLGIVAEKYPEIVQEISRRGHEIASHGYSHQALSQLGKSRFEAEIQQSVQLLESITGRRPLGFRAPYFSVDNSTKWAFDVLCDYGFKYDSSIFPIKNRYYGVPEAPIYPYRPSRADVAKTDPYGEIVEFPLAVVKMGKNIPVAGGFYLRVLPLWFLRFAVRRINRKRVAVIYAHPWETYLKTPRLNGVPLLSRFISHFGTNSALGKLKGLLESFEFKPLCDLLEDFELYGRDGENDMDNFES